MRARRFPTWSLVLSLVAFAAGLAACAARGWHAPRWWVIVPIIAIDIAASLTAADLWHRRRSAAALAHLGERGATWLRAAAAEGRKLLALLVTLGYALVGGVVLRLGLDHQPRVPASFIASAWLATLPWVALAAFPLVLSWVRFGRDGVRVGHRFLPFRAIRGVRAWGKAVRIEQHGAAPVVVQLPSEDAARSVAAYVEEVRREPGPSGAAFARKGRPPRLWRRALFETDYRSAGVGPDQADQVLASPSASSEERVGAALVLAASGPEGRQRVRVAASELADPRAREALELAAEDALDDDALARLSLEDGERRGVR